MAYPSIDAMRDAVKKLYPTSQSWSNKVDKMPDGQILAIYNKNCK